jgi:putative nucleotidyltransferase with HDIG domain
LLRSDKFRGKDTGKLKALLIKENSKIIVRDLFDNPRSGEKIKQTQTMVGGMINSIMANRDTIYDLLSIRGYDYYTYTHSVNVCVLAVGLGVAVNMDQMQVERLGLGAMLHDIGKSVIPAEIVNKQGKLDDLEYRIIQTHVAEGEKILKENHRLPPDSLAAVTQHHEKMSGRGYPLSLTEKDITPFGRIIAIADCYDALTTTRPYRQSLTPFTALGIIAKEAGNYDPELLRVFIKMLGKI